MHVCLQICTLIGKVHILKYTGMEPIHIHVFWTNIKQDKRLAKLSQKVLRATDLKSSNLLIPDGRFSYSVQFICINQCLDIIQNRKKLTNNSLEVPQLNIKLPYDPGIPLRDIYPREMQTHNHTKTCTQMLIAVLFITAKKEIQRKCPSSNEWTKCGIQIQ